MFQLFWRNDQRGGGVDGVLPVVVSEKMLDVDTQPSNRLETVSDPAAPTSQRFFRVVTPKWP